MPSLHGFRRGTRCNVAGIGLTSPPSFPSRSPDCVPEPSKPQDHVLPTESGDRKRGSVLRDVDTGGSGPRLPVICPASLGVPSTLSTGTGRESRRVAILFRVTNSRSMKDPVAPLSTSADVRKGLSGVRGCEVRCRGQGN